MRGPPIKLAAVLTVAIGAAATHYEKPEPCDFDCSDACKSDEHYTDRMQPPPWQRDGDVAHDSNSTYARARKKRVR